MTSNPNQMPGLPGPPQRLNPADAARRFGDLVKALVVIVTWFVIGIAALAAGYVGLRAIWWAVDLAKNALGI